MSSTIPQQELIMSSEIPIRYINSTGETDFQVLVFTKNYSTNTPATVYAAWQVLKAQTEVDFVYPVDIEVGASYVVGSQTIIAGPFGAELGSTWQITQHTEESTKQVYYSLHVKSIINVSPYNNILGHDKLPRLYRGSRSGLTFLGGGGSLLSLNFESG